MIRFSTALRNALASNYGLGMAMNKGVIRLYDDTIPASPDLAPTGNLLGAITTNGIAYIPGTNKEVAGLVVKLFSPGMLQKNGVWRLMGTRVGTATWFRWYSSQIDDYGANTNFLRVDGNVGSDLFLSNPAITPLTNVEISTFTLQLQMSN